MNEFEDLKRDHFKEHSLECLFNITIASVIGGAESWYEVEEFLSLSPKNLSVCSDCGSMIYVVQE